MKHTLIAFTLVSTLFLFGLTSGVKLLKIDREILKSGLHR